jgi:hypothetical protein
MAMRHYSKWISDNMQWCISIMTLLTGLYGCGGGGGDSSPTPTPTPTPTPVQNKAPVIGSNLFQLQEDNILQQQIIASDVDNDPLTYQLLSSSNASGNVTMQADGSFSYQPALDFFGDASFTFSVSDGKAPAVCGEVKLTVQPVNDLPIVNIQQFQSQEDTIYNAQLLATDVDKDPLSFTLLSSEPTTSGVTVSQNGALSLKPVADFNGKISLKLQVSDGKSAAIPFNAEITVAAVNDTPELVIGALPAVLDTGASYPLQLTATDVDGDTLTFKNLNPEAFFIDFNQQPAQLTVLPTSIATQQAVIIQVSDPQAAAAQQQQTVAIALVNPTGMGRTLVGKVQSNRLNLVIVGDGFTAAEQNKLRDAAVKFSKVFFDHSEIGTHRDGWSLHVLDAHSVQSGADDPATNTIVDTLFDGNFGCSGIDRLYCVNEAKVFNYVLQHYPQFDHVLVVGNSTKYGGAGGNLATFTLNENATDVAIHELGHSFAGLADEYVDESSAPIYLPYYCESCYANVTKVTDPNLIKWRHWFSDPVNIPTLPGQQGIGLFEGSYYHAKDFYRPKDSSFMLSLGAPVGEVNGEAWVSKLYQTIGMHYNQLPQQENVVQPRGQSMQFAFELSVGNAQQQVTWWLNEQQLPQFDNNTSIDCCQDQQQNYQLKARITDISGLIKDPALQSKEVQWNVQIQ